MPIAVIPSVSEETLRQLLAEGHEYETLDYKGYCDLSSHDELLEIVKDIGAMQIEGGYIVVGADDRGEPTGKVTDNHIRLFEQSSLRSKVRKFISEPFEIRAQHHTIDGNNFVLIYIAEHADGFAVFSTVGNNSKGVCIFRVGDVFARHGSASERWNQHDIAAIKRKIRERERNRWLTEWTEAHAGQVVRAPASNLAAGPASALTWRLDNDTFLEVIIEQLRKQDTVPLTLFLSGIASEVASLLTETNGAEYISLILDRLTCLAALMLRLHNDDLFRSVIGALVAIYKVPIDTHTAYRKDIALSPAQLWFMVLQRLVGVGAVAERLKKWDAIRYLVLQKGRGFEADGYLNWYRHALTQASKANLLNRDQVGKVRQEPLLTFAQLQAERLTCLRTDVIDEEELLDSLCRFDILASIVGIDNAGLPDDSAFFPNFANYFSRRSTPAIMALLDDENMRKALFRGTDIELAEALLAIQEVAFKQSSRINGWNGFRDDTVTGFIRMHRDDQ